MTGSNHHAGRFAVMGNPVAHSKSPQIHRAFAAQFDRDIDYRAEHVELDQFASAVRAFFATGGRGLNITLPFKSDAFALAEHVSERARIAGAANFLALSESGEIHADNTDGAGLIRDLSANLGWRIAGKKVLILGAGGAVQGVLPALLAEQPDTVFVANRTAARAEALVADRDAVGVNCHGGGFSSVADHDWDLVINGTSAGLSGELPMLPDTVQINAGSACYDMAYGRGATAFTQWARARGAERVADGLGMLVEQAAESFFLWLGQRPDTASVINTLRAAP